jgi:alcohol dehydrogenase (nicotinoprotein)
MEVPLMRVTAAIVRELKLDELISQRYQLDEINQGYQDLDDGKLIRGVIVHET